MTHDFVDSHQQMMQMITSYWITQLVRGAAEISLADVLASRPLDVDEIATATGCDRDFTFRFLRACAPLGLVAATRERRFASTPLLETLRDADPRSLRGAALALGAPGHWLPWGRFPEVLATGRSQTVEALGADIFEYYAATPREAADFSRAMSGVTASLSRDVATKLKTGGVARAVDVGGAEGALLVNLLDANSRLRGVIFDRPEIVANALAALDHRHRDRVEAIGGDFFEAVPAADLYVLKFILHDWDDAHCLTILRNCRRALVPGGRLAIIEHVLGEVGEAGPAALMDINMMVLASGRERTLGEYERLLAEAEFGDTRATPVGVGLVLIEASGR